MASPGPSPSAAPAEPTPGAGRRTRLGMAAVALLLALAWVPSVSMERAWGWDESMHAAYPAARIALAARDGSGLEVARAVHDCRLYPFAWPAALGGVQVLTGVSERACRASGRLVWIAGLLGLFLLAREVVEAGRRARGGAALRGDDLAPWLALALGALSPLALAYSGSLFLETPFVVVSIFALRAWLRRGPEAALRREVAAGAWVALAFFTKFNYGLLLGFGLLLDLLVDALGEVRAGRAAALGQRTLALASVPLLAGLWWFVLPLPFGLETGAAHRMGLAHFLGGNRDPGMAVPGSIRAVHWTCFLVLTPRVLLAQGLGMARTLPALRGRGVRLLWIVFLAGGIPTWTHGFHQDRFLLPGAVAIWCLAGLGLARLLPQGARARAVALGVLAAALLVFPSRDAWWVLERVGLANPELAEYQRGELEAWRDLRGARRIPTNGLLREESEAWLDLLQAEVDAQTRVGWIGMSAVFSPAAMHLGLIERGRGAPAEVLRGELEGTFVAIGREDPAWPRERLLSWAADFDAILTTDPIDATGAGGREFLVRYIDDLLAEGAWTSERLGEIAVRRPNREPHPVALFACRPVP